MDHKRVFRQLTVAVSAAAVATAMAACSSSSSSSSSSAAPATSTGAASSAPAVAASGSASGGAALTAIKAAAEKLQTRPTHIPITTPVGKTIPSGKSIDYVECTAPTCKIEGDGFVSAATALGWKVKVLPAAPTPQAIASAFTQVIQDHPDAVVSIGYSETSYTSQFRQLQAMHIPNVVGFVADTSSTDGPYVVTNGVAAAQQQGSAMATYIAAQSDASAHILYVDVPAYPIFVPVKAAFEKQLAADCPSCTMDTLDIPAADLGTTSAQDIANYISGHPDINTVFSVLDDLNVGLRAALSQAGVTGQISLYGNSTDVPNLAYLANGTETGSYGNPIVEVGWQFADVLARIFTGVPYAASADTSAGVVWTKSNIPSTTALAPVVADYQQQYKTLWGK